MRKILLTLFSMVVTASLQAITILWTLPDSNPSNSWVQTVMGDPERTDDTLGLYLVYSESGYDTAEDVWKATSTPNGAKVVGSTVGGSATINDAPTNGVSFGFLEESASTSLVIEISSTKGLGAGNYYLVVFDPASLTPGSDAQYAVAQAKSFTGTSTSDDDQENGFYQTTMDPTLGLPEMGNFVELEWMGGHWAAVPEPTALALLVLGVAGLALRRKI